MNDLSIRKQLLTWLLVPLCAALVVCSLLGYGLAHTVANATFDRGLVNSAAAVAARLRWSADTVHVDMPPAAQAILRYSSSDSVFYQVVSASGKRISGDRVIPTLSPLPLEQPQPALFNNVLDGRPIRVARVRCVNPERPDDAVFVQVAETLEARNSQTRMLTIAIIAPQLLLIALGAISVWVCVGKGLRPLKTIQQAVKERSSDDLSPLTFLEVPTEVRPLIEEINDLLVRLSNEMESQRRFVANAAHQLRIPLAGLRTHSAQAQNVCVDGRISQLVAEIDRGVRLMTHVVDRLISLARIEPSSQQNYSKVDLNFIVSDSTSNLIEKALSKGVDLTFLGAGCPAVVLGDREALLDLTNNLIDNAVQYTPAGGFVAVRVCSDTGVQLVVEDSGPGIPESENERVFEAFYRLGDDSIPGSGLGLAIVREIAASHNAQVSLKQSPRRAGTVIEVSFASAASARLNAG